MNRYRITTSHAITKKPVSTTHFGNNPYQALRQAFGGHKSVNEFTVTGCMFTVSFVSDGFGIHNGIIKQIDHNV